MLQQSQEQGPGFINVNGKQFIRDGKPYYFLGTNFWYGMNLGSSGQGGDRDRLLRELDHLKKSELKTCVLWGPAKARIQNHGECGPLYR